ncbi:hypothetical protein [Paenibacillus sp. UNC499MF]|uniref:hypothetical protein n=1 Tax=Paenibacillus sp. UNC499MF TaxID=1502751 RepID=UPI00089FAE8D|nr:hypothetical protein [Paenibacillus sp. UNC499MF]SEG08658.1 hypothetical protein SAMN02799616_01803 [Paenibacillus sp. UNC499MF]
MKEPVPVSVKPVEGPVLLFMQLILAGISLTSFIMTVYRGNMQQAYVFGGLLLIWAVLLAVQAVRAFRKRSFVLLEPHALVAEGRRVKPDEIEEIRRWGKFGSDVIGIKLKGRFDVPAHLTFRLKDEEGMEALCSWAEARNIAFIRKSFVRWI